MIEYDKLGLEEFDAVVTGELAHLAIRFEHHLNDIIIDVFQVCREKDFRKLILHREGLKFQDKIEIVRCCIPILGEHAEKLELKKILNDVEVFKSWRNALAHGCDVGSSAKPLKLRIEVINRAGKEKVVEITPDSHQAMLDEMDALLSKLEKAAEVINEIEK